MGQKRKPVAARDLAHVTRGARTVQSEYLSQQQQKQEKTVFLNKRFVGSQESRMSQTNCPLAHTTLTELCDQQLTQLLGDSNYTQSKVHEWNTEIIVKTRNMRHNNVLTVLTPLTPQYKWILTSTIIEIVSDTKRGIHAAQGAYWNCEKDDTIKARIYWILCIIEALMAVLYFLQLTYRRNAVARMVKHSNACGAWTVMDSPLDTKNVILHII
ncbi:hypothetical protein PMAC_001122 [Pneumocystis sp. 'macacae']|nr:hypothetical protein PMAC_001122 [Pneumocystis sp. 'macacae']